RSTAEAPHHTTYTTHDAACATAAEE
ncbi:hypothetical protein EVA_11900, partial [gut metagenome]